MFELETLAAFGIGAGLVIISPLLARVVGKDHAITQGVSNTGRNVTKTGVKLGLWVGDKVGGVFESVKSGVGEVGETFGDIYAEARADMTPETSTSKSK